MSTSLRALLDDAGVAFAGAANRMLDAGDDGPEITGVTHDSRRVRPGSMFCCVRGAVSDGHGFVADAVRSGASAIVCERAVNSGLPEVRVNDTRRAMAALAAAYHGHPSAAMRVVGVTGTNGKTTTVRMVQAVLAAHGIVAETIGTLTGVRTTPESTELQEALAAMRDRGVGAVAMEVSSHALVQHRVDATTFAVVAFTNLSRDHLDFHPTMEEYFKAKAQLFTPSFAPVAVIDVDTPHGLLLASTTDIATVVRTAASRTDIIELRADGSHYRWRGLDVHLPIPGRFNIANALVASEICVALGVAPATVAGALGALEPVPGRFQRLESDAPFNVVIDFAHTPDGLENVLGAARETVGDGRVVVVFGCGGDRDATKRPLMGRAAREGADVVIVTSDNPRSEDPASIVAQVVAGMAQQPDIVELDRRQAIRLGLEAARPGDIVVIAGKGHETTQQIGTALLPFDDMTVAAEELAAFRSAGGI